MNWQWPKRLMRMWLPRRLASAQVWAQAWALASAQVWAQASALAWALASALASAQVWAQASALASENNSQGPRKEVSTRECALASWPRRNESLCRGKLKP